MRFVKVVNRTNKKLQYTWMGQHFELQPNEQTGPIHEQYAVAARNQNPIYGSEDDFGNQESYVAIVGEEDYPHDASPVEWTNNKTKERFNFVRAMAPDDKVVVIQGKGFSTEGRYQGSFEENKMKTPLEDSKFAR